MRKDNAMRRKLIIFTIAILLVGFVSNTYAQIFITDDDLIENRLGNDVEGGFVLPGIMPDHDTTWDYTPIGDGLWLLGSLGVAYLLGKRKKNDNQ